MNRRLIECEDCQGVGKIEREHRSGHSGLFGSSDNDYLTFETCTTCHGNGVVDLPPEEERDEEAA